MNPATRSLTLMFTDLTGSASLYERLGDIEAAHAVDRCQKRITRCVEAARGRLLQNTGDELLAAFDKPEDACLAAIDIQERIADLPPASGLQLNLRIGLHTCSCAEGEETPDSLSINTAARVAGRAKARQILASAPLLAALPEALGMSTQALPELGVIAEGETAHALHQIHWQKTAQATEHQTVTPVTQLIVTHHDLTFCLQSDSAPFTLGRDVDSHLHIEDRKVSRRHGRIEYQPAVGFVYIDSSRNGSFVAEDGQQEFLLRDDQIMLKSNTRICFGTSGNDPEGHCIHISLQTL